MKKSLNVKQWGVIGVAITFAIVVISFNIVGVTGNVLWDLNHCTKSNPCPAGEGDCDLNSHCKTGYCAQNIGNKYGQSRTMDVCECLSGTTWDGTSCSSGDSISDEVTYQGVLNMLNHCSKFSDDRDGGRISCNKRCSNLGKICILGEFFLQYQTGDPLNELGSVIVTCDKTVNDLSEDGQGASIIDLTCICCSEP